MLVLSACSDGTRYDESDPDYRRLSAALAEAKALLDMREPTAADGIDLSMLNGGRWRAACLLGGYTDPVQAVAKFNAVVRDRDRSRFGAARSAGFRLAAVEEFEAAIAYVDFDDMAHFIHFSNGLGAGGQHFARCITKPETRVPLGT